MAGIIPKDQLINVRRWQADTFDRPNASRNPQKKDTPPPPAEPPPPVVPQPSEEELEAIRETARQAGYEAGEAAGKAAGEASLQEKQAQTAEKLAQLLDNFQSALAGLEQGMAEKFLDLSLDIAAQLTRSALEVKRDLLLPIVREAIGSMPLHHGTLNLHLHPDDAEALREPLAAHPSTSNLHVVPDAEVTAGGCLLKAGHSEVDASIETRWQKVVEAIGSDKAWLSPS
ncbi:MAG: FliH/SctL family protein [Dechloromonas sp.]|nr:FliH/SctL family protein [Dechloromonas sp.]